VLGIKGSTRRNKKGKTKQQPWKKKGSPEVMLARPMDGTLVIRFLGWVGGEEIKEEKKICFGGLWVFCKQKLRGMSNETNTGLVTR